MMRKRIAPVAVVTAAGLLCVSAYVAFALWNASRALRTAESSVRVEHDIRFVVRPFTPTRNAEYQPVSAPAVFAQAASFQDHLYIAGPAGLFEYQPSGELVRQYIPGRDLPGSPLVALTSAFLTDARQRELIVATAADGLLAFDGQAFRQIIPDDADARTITAVAPTASGRLLIGTKKRGVLVYDGKAITNLHPTLANCYVTALAGDESDLWVGTLHGGVLHFSAGATQAFSEDDGLPDRQVTSLAVGGETTYVGTPLGTAVFTRGQFSRVLAPGVLATAVLATGDQLYIGSEDQGVLAIPLQERRANIGANPGSQLMEVRQLFTSAGSVFALARSGLYELKPHAFHWERVLQPGAAVLTDRNISALVADGQGRLWIGYFDRGVDILSPDGAHARHIEDEHVFCINRMFSDSKTGGLDIGTANGLVRFDGSGNEQQILTRSDGLIADDVTDLDSYGEGLVLATPAGLTFLDASGARSLYAFQGLVNNHVYAVGVSGDELLAGTLGGISVLEKGNVAVNYTTANSGLKNNWITAVVRVGREWMVGTYGAGVLTLDASGHFHGFDGASGNFEVNPNAMLVTTRFVLAGTLGKGLYLYDRNSGRWSVIEQGLPSLNVTALASVNGYVYIGTDNGLVRVPEQALHS